ncbi:hypothetical protein [Streptococcus sanguinis]|nr:hypothetical protein [Streptococcus sanguinis]
MKNLNNLAYGLKKSFGSQASANFEDLVGKNWTKAFLIFKK